MHEYTYDAVFQEQWKQVFWEKRNIMYLGRGNYGMFPNGWVLPT